MQRIPSTGWSGRSYIDWYASVDIEPCGVIAEHPEVPSATRSQRAFYVRGRLCGSAGRSYYRLRPGLKCISVVGPGSGPEPIVSRPSQSLSSDRWQFSHAYLAWRWLRSDVFWLCRMDNSGLAYPEHQMIATEYFDGGNTSYRCRRSPNNTALVARVEELMTLCDCLEETGRLADEQHARSSRPRCSMP